MHRYCTRALQAGRELYQQVLKKFKKNDEENSDSEDHVALRQSVDRIAESIDDESSSAVRLSRRSSLLVDLVSLFQRSSLNAKPIRLPGQLVETHDENDDEEDEEPRPTSKGWVLETIRQKKEAIIRLRSQPWNMKRKRRTLKYA
ncbi:unnamed protein product [Onchocerca ochengi]|uniref:Uncharacterized protein n=1 Tax=Onchocerca ochengi TaxID=42157 RepID=A0A182ENY8_ONCOC|nr:unnamed protein product [Onchocerca ochengi]